MRAGPAREAALKVLTDCRRRNAWADAALRSRTGDLSPADAALCTRMVYGVIQNRMLLDYDLRAYCTQNLEKLQPPLREILQLGAYQILFLDRVPDRAAVDTSVELAKSAGRPRAAGLVNAVLRKLSACRDHLPPLPEDPIEALSLWYSHPLWLTARLVDLLGVEEAEAFLASDNGAPPLEVQANPLRTSPEALAAEWQAAGIEARPHPWVPGCLELTGAGDVTALPAFREGRCLVQDPAARLAVLLADLSPGQAVLDLCAAPGGKAFGAAMAVGEKGSVLACDINGSKLRHVREGAKRLGLDGILQTREADGREFHPEWAEKFDAVLVDAPCSGLGVIRKKPDIRDKDPAALTGLPAVQAALLDNAARYVRPGGTLLYSTCTILPEENENIAEAFLSTHGEFVPFPFTLPNGEGPYFCTTLWPQRHGTDGFFLCRTRKRTPGGHRQRDEALS